MSGLQATEPKPGRRGGDWPLPKIIEQRPRKFHCHPAGKCDVEALLRFFGAECVYGIRRIELRQGDDASGRLKLGRLYVPGRIVIYDQRTSPWRLGRLSAAEREHLRAAGARIELLDGTTIVHWSDAALKDFMLFSVLLHEIGHHLLQHHKGKRVARIARTKDHEAFANRFAERCRETYYASRGTDDR